MVWKTWEPKHGKADLPAELEQGEGPPALALVALSLFHEVLESDVVSGKGRSTSKIPRVVLKATGRP